MDLYIQTKTIIFPALPFLPYKTHLSEDIPPSSYPGKGRNDNLLDDFPLAFSYLSNPTLL
jgi:hypothetical protein